MTAYTAWSVVFGEQPSAAKWNILGTNDSSFNDGTGISNLEIGSGHTALKVDYKFRARRTSAQNTGSSAFAIVNFATEDFDTGNNFDTVTNVGRFTAPIALFGVFGWHIESSTAATILIASLFKNGVEYGRGGDFRAGSAVQCGVDGIDLISLNTNDYCEIYAFGNSALAIDTSNNRFVGALYSTT